MPGKTRYCIVKYDNLGLKADTTREGRAVSYSSSSAAAPIPLEGRYESPEDCVAAIEALMANPDALGEHLDIILANGANYSGPRYTYVMGECNGN